MSARGGRGRLAPYLVGLPGGLWLAIFFVLPLLVMFSLSLQSGNAEQGFQFTWEWSNYTRAWELYSTQFIRSVVYAIIVTALCLALAYPMAYWIAFYGGARKSTYLFLILLPFFVSFVIRTASWKFILNDQGFVLGPLKEIGLLPEDFHLLATTTAVIGGLTYNYLPFMVLPLYVALERVDPSLVEAAHDLFAGRASAFRKVVLPLSLPGVFAGVLITFVPVASDFVNSGILGGTQTTMIGNIIQTVYLNSNNYPLASAMSFLLMAALLVGIFTYARVLGTEQVMDVAER
ncbi:MAG TPA: ABC transporter permease [Actinomycetes bacterium]|nr:ABC transporter permease [Actinomycetes bacterium]